MGVKKQGAGVEVYKQSWSWKAESARSVMCPYPVCLPHLGYTFVTKQTGVGNWALFTQVLHLHCYLWEIQLRLCYCSLKTNPKLVRKKLQDSLYRGWCFEEQAFSCNTETTPPCMGSYYSSQQICLEEFFPLVTLFLLGQDGRNCSSHHSSFFLRLATYLMMRLTLSQCTLDANLST